MGVLSSLTCFCFNLFFRLKRKCAFTLAEVLVTLGIIGVVSALTIPTLMQNHQRKTYVTQLHKLYTELSQALIQYQTDRNAVNLREAGLSYSNMSELFNKYFKVIQDCGSDQAPCFADSYRNITGAVCDFECREDCVVLASGASIGRGGNSGGNTIIHFVVDINGSQGPNIFGRDAFSLFLYTNNGVIDDLSVPTKDGDAYWDTSVTAPLSEELREENFQKACLDSTGSGWHGCLGKILNDNWEMTY